MFTFVLVLSSVFTVIVLVYSIETFFYKNMFGEVLKPTDPNFDVYELAIDNCDFKMLKGDTLHSLNEGSAIRYVDEIDISILKRDFFHIHSKELDDRRVVSGTDLYKKISNIKESVKKNRSEKRIERMNKFSNL